MKKFIFLISFFAVFSNAFSQSDSTRYKHLLKSNLTQYAVRDFGIEYEYLTKSNIGIFAGASYKIGSQDEVSSGSFLGGNHPSHYLSADAYTFSLGPNFIISQDKRGHSYFSGVFFFRKLWYDKLLYNTGCPRDMCEHKRVQSMQGTVFGWKALLGYRWFFPLSNKLAFMLDVFAGAGYRAKEYYYTVYGTDSGTNRDQIVPLDNPYESKETRHPISLQAGVKIGLSFK